MSDVFELFFGQVDPLKNTTYTFGLPDILGNMQIYGLNGSVGSVTQGVFGEANVEIDGESFQIRDSVFGNYEIETDEGVYTAMDRIGGGESFYHFGQVEAYTTPGLFGQEYIYDGQTHELIGQTGMNAFGQSTITVPGSIDMHHFEATTSIDTLSSAYDFTEVTDFIGDPNTFLDLMDLL